MSVEEITKDMKYFNYYQRAYKAVLGGFLREYQQQIPFTPEQGIADKQNFNEQNASEGSNSSSSSVGMSDTSSGHTGSLNP